MARKRQAENEDIDLNMTPMLDVVFILLIFFIVTSVFVREPGINPFRPDVDGKAVKPVILVAVSDTDEIWVNRKQVEIEELRVEIDALRAENPRGEATVQGDRNARFSTVFSVMEVLQEAGVPAQYVSVEN